MEQILKAAKALKSGGIVVYPSDTYYALGANIYDDQAISQVAAAKGILAGSRPLPVAVSSILQIEDIVQLGSDYRAVLEEIWPGPVMFLLPKRDSVSSLLSGPSSLIGVIQFQNSAAQKLIQRAGFPITATSANISGQGDATRPDKINLKRSPELILKGVCPYTDQDLTIVDLFNNRIIQEGIWTDKVERLLY